MKQPIEYSVEPTDCSMGLCQWLHTEKERGGKKDKTKPTPKQKLGSYQGSDQKYSYKIIATGLSHPGDKKCFMQISYTYEMQSV